MKKYNINTIEEFKLNVVGAEASVRLRKKQNRNNIKIFDEHKLNAVGETSLGDPQTKYKYINKPMSNEISKCYYTFLKIEKDNKTGRRGRRPLQVIKSNFGITLIALIITIIVLLILAGVTLNMVMGENGIFGKANNAKNKTEVAQYEEELRMCVLEMQTEEASNGRTFNMDTIKNNLDTYTQKLEDETIEWKEKDIEEPTGIYKGYNFYIDKKYGAHIKDKATGIQISMKILSEIPETGYTNQDVSLKITITNNEKGINKIIKPDGNTESLNGAKTYEEEKTATENTKYTYVVTDTEGKEETKEVEIKIIDKNAPQDFSIEAQVTEEGMQITATPEDTEETETNSSSGINKVEYILTNEKNETTTYETNLIKELPSGTYSVYAKAYDKAGNEKKSTNTVTGLKVSAVYKNITAQMVAEHPELYYGLTVTNYESQNGQKDWKIFYSDWKENSDDAHIFLITGDYADLSQPDRLDANTGLILPNNNKYTVYWSNSLPAFSEDIEDNILTRFMAKGYNINEHKENPNSKWVSTLLNTNNWEKYKDSNNKAEYAIGGPTIEMWFESWNNLYKNVDGEIFCNNSNEYGYYMGTTSEPTNNEYIYFSKRKGYNNKLFYSHTTKVSDTSGDCSYVWFASNSSTDKRRIFTNNYQGGIVDAWGSGSYSGSIGLRPVVSLNKGVTVDAKDSE